jgi:radical SAM protein with 4Fe4S-binding SPASM domain
MGNPDLEHVEQILRSLQEAEVLDIVTLGGDLFSYPQHAEVIRMASSMQFGLGIITNATQITQETANTISPFVRTCGVSIRGSNRSGFDRMAGVAGAFDAMLRGLRALADNGISISLLYDPVRGNTDGLFTMTRMLIEDLRLPIISLQLNRIIPQGRAIEHWQAIAVSKDDYLHLFEQMLEVERCFGIQTSAGDAFPFCQVPPRFWPLLARCEYGALWGAVTSRGDLKRCSVHGVSLGNILEQSLTEIWQSHRVLLSYRSLECVPPICHGCVLLKECAGACSLANAAGVAASLYEWEPIGVGEEAGRSYASQLPSEHEISLDDSDDNELSAVRPTLTARARFRSERVGILCVPEPMNVVMEQSALPWLIVDEAERRIVELCDGNHTFEEIVAATQGNLSDHSRSMVARSLSFLRHHGYLD